MLHLLLLVVIWIPAHVGWTWFRPLRACHGRCKGTGRIRGWGRGHSLCATCGGNGREPKPMHTFLYERAGLFRYPADETGPGWGRRRRRMERKRSAGRKVVR